MHKFDEIEELEIRQVKARIEERLQDVLSILPPGIYSNLTKAIVTGGISASYFHGEKENDVDLYFMDKESIDLCTSLLPDMMGNILDVNEKYGLETMVNGKMVTAHAITFKNGLQIITMETADARKKFDFEHCMPYYSIGNKLYHISRSQYDSIKGKKLVLNRDGVSPDAKRLEKFVNRGWVL